MIRLKFISKRGYSLSLSLFDFEKRISRKREEGDGGRVAPPIQFKYRLPLPVSRSRKLVGGKKKGKAGLLLSIVGTARKYFHKRERKEGAKGRQRRGGGLARNDGPIFVISVHAVNFRRRESGSRVITLRTTNFRSLAESIRVRLLPTNRHR